MKNKAKWLLLFIPLLFVVLTMVIALVNIFQRSIYDDNGFTLKYLKAVVAQPLYTKVLFNTLKTGVIVTVCTVLIAYPMAYLSVRSKKSWIRTFASSVLGKYAGKNFCMADYTGKKRIIEYSAYETWYYR